VYVIRLTILTRPSTAPSQYSKQQLTNRVDGIILVARIIVVVGQPVDPVECGGSNSARRRRNLVDTGGRTILYVK